MTSKLVICASGDGSNFEAIVRASRSGLLQAEVSGLIVNRGGIGVLERAERLKVPVAIISPKGFASREEWDAAMVARLRTWSADWVVLAGYLALVGPQVLTAYQHRIVNSHPALLPKFGGAGMYGDRVHAAVLAAGERETGITVHLIDEVYDRGAILAQERVAVLPGDTPELLAARVKTQETAFYPKVLNDLITGRITTG
ncbi:MAG: phosphoribosylglycinamide formyltransferase [Bdellovibrionales bacterium]|nr:phosphoribosylglycinamide formyltransferase [Bdellovibrionales bacterium]